MAKNSNFDKLLNDYESVVRSRKRGTVLFIFLAIVSLIPLIILACLNNIFFLFFVFTFIVFLGLGIIRIYQYYIMDKKYPVFNELKTDMINKNIRLELQKRNVDIKKIDYEVSPYIYLNIKYNDNDLCFKNIKIYKNKTYFYYELTPKMLETDVQTFKKYLHKKYGYVVLKIKNKITKDEIYDKLVEFINNESEDYIKLKELTKIAYKEGKH